MRRVVQLAVGLCFLAPCLRAQSQPQMVFTAETGPTTYLEAFTVTAPGSAALAPVAGNPFPERQTPVALAVNPGASLLFVGNQENSVSVFTIGSTGALSEISASPFD